MVDQIESFSCVSVSLGHNFIHHLFAVGNIDVLRKFYGEVFDDTFHLSDAIGLHSENGQIGEFVEGRVLGVLVEDVERVVDLVVEDKNVFVGRWAVEKQIVELRSEDCVLFSLL